MFDRTTMRLVAPTLPAALALTAFVATSVPSKHEPGPQRPGVTKIAQAESQRRLKWEPGSRRRKGRRVRDTEDDDYGDGDIDDRVGRGRCPRGETRVPQRGRGPQGGCM
jgi:hypothetical protein